MSGYVACRYFIAQVKVFVHHVGYTFKNDVTKVRENYIHMLSEQWGGRRMELAIALSWIETMHCYVTSSELL
jgi:hypothetical protein